MNNKFENKQTNKQTTTEESPKISKDELALPQSSGTNKCCGSSIKNCLIAFAINFIELIGLINAKVVVYLKLVVISLNKKEISVTETCIALTLLNVLFYFLACAEILLMAFHLTGLTSVLIEAITFLLESSAKRIH